MMRRYSSAAIFSIFVRVVVLLKAGAALLVMVVILLKEGGIMVVDSDSTICSSSVMADWGVLLGMRWQLRGDHPWS